MAKRGKNTPGRDDEARDRAAHGQSLARGDTGEGDTGVAPGQQGISNRLGDGSANKQPPPAQAGVPPLQDQERTSLDSPSQSGRPRDEGDDRIERTGRQDVPRSDPEAVRPLGSTKPDDTTM